MSNDDILLQILKAINDLREEVRENKREIQKSREIENAHWEEIKGIKAEMNEMKAEIKEIRNEIKFEVNKAMERERKNIENILWSFQTSVENMFNENKQEIIKLKQIVGI